VPATSTFSIKRRYDRAVDFVLLANSWRVLPGASEGGRGWRQLLIRALLNSALKIFIHIFEEVHTLNFGRKAPDSSKFLSFEFVRPPLWSVKSM
jgi:hypothetical protein